MNVPPYATESALIRIFSIAGQVENIIIVDSYMDKTKYQVKSDYFNEAQPFKFMIAFVVYKKSESVDLMLRAKELPPLSTEELPVLTGVAKWTVQYNNRVVDTEKMQTEIDDYMKHYDKVKRAEDEQEGDADDGDGAWTTVGKNHKNGFKQKESVISKLEQKMHQQKKKAKNLTNFYTFETRDTKKQQLMELRKKFEDDKMKMNSMRQKRTFKPY